MDLLQFLLGGDTHWLSGDSSFLKSYRKTLREGLGRSSPEHRITINSQIYGRVLDRNKKTFWAWTLWALMTLDWSKLEIKT